VDWAKIEAALAEESAFDRAIARRDWDAASAELTRRLLEERLPIVELAVSPDSPEPLRRIFVEIRWPDQRRVGLQYNISVSFRDKRVNARLYLPGLQGLVRDAYDEWLKTIDWWELRVVNGPEIDVLIEADPAEEMARYFTNEAPRSPAPMQSCHRRVVMHRWKRPLPRHTPAPELAQRLRDAAERVEVGDLIAARNALLSAFNDAAVELVALADQKPVSRDGVVPELKARR
jgi:hypothetical protein